MTEPCDCDDCDGPVIFEWQLEEMTEEIHTGNATIRLAKMCVIPWKRWRSRSGGPIPCTSGWRDYQTQLKAWQGDSNRFGHPDRSYHCKGRAVDVNNTWLNALSAADQTKLRQAAKASGWEQARWWKGEAGCGERHRSDEPWHFSWAGCG